MGNQSIYVLDQFGEECPIGVQGELYIGGKGVALGYLNDENKTGASFIKHSLGKLYKTGDYGVMHKEGYIEFLGRKDSQVKIRGHRIELGEIEAQLQQRSEIQNAIVAVQENADGDKQLVGYVIPKDKGDFEVSETGQFFIHEVGDSENAEKCWKAAVEAGEVYSEQIPNELSVDGLMDCHSKIEALGTAYIYKGIKDLSIYMCIGESNSVEDIIDLCKIKPQYKKLLKQWLDVLCEDGILIKNEGDIYTSVKAIPECSLVNLWDELKEHPAYSAWQEALSYIEICGNNMLELLQGEISPLTILFPDGSWGRAESVYRYNPWAKFYNSIVSGVIKSIVDCYPENKVVRILEFGAGTGGTSASIFPNLHFERTEYVYTDVSTFFTNEAKKRFENYPFIQYGILDINKDLLCQGYTPHTFDIIIGANVLHDAHNIDLTIRNLKSLLSPNGFFIILEATKNARLHKVSIGFIEGLSSYEDERVEKNEPMLSAEKWEQKFIDGGFSKVTSYPEQPISGESFEQHIIMARGPEIIEKMNQDAIRKYLMDRLPEYMVPSFFVELDCIPLNANGKVNKRALPMPLNISTRSKAEYAEPRNEAELKIARIWEEVFKVEHVGINDNFFELGGDSLKAIQISAKAKKENIDISIADVYKYRNIANLVSSMELGNVVNDFVEIPKAMEAESYPMSSAQRRLYIMNEMMGPNTTYNIFGMLSIKELQLSEPLDEKKLQSAFDKLLEQEEILRTSFHMESGSLVQTIEKEARVLVETSKVEKIDFQAEYEKFVKPFNLSKAPLLRVKLISTPEDIYLLLDIHHIIFDLISKPIILREIKELYEGRELPKRRIQYKDYSMWQASQDYSVQEAYWKEEFSGEIPILNLRTDYPRPQEQSYRGNTIQVKVDEDICAGVKELAKKYGATEFMVMISALILLLNKYSQQDEIIVGTPVSGRTHVDTDSMIGMFVNTLAIKGKVNPCESYENLLYAVKEKCLNAYDNQEYPFEDLVEAVEVNRNLSRNPIFDILFAMHEIGGISENLLKQIGTSVETRVSRFDLTLTVLPAIKGYLINLEYCIDLFEEETIRRIGKHYINLVKAIIENPKQIIRKLSMTDAEEEKRLLVDFNATEAEYPYDKTIIDLFEEQVEKTPNRIAAVYGNQELSYMELNARANRLAHKLRTDFEIQPDDFVAIMADRGLEMVVGIFAILKSGAAYVPIDPTYPEERIQFILEDCKPKAVLVGDIKSGVPDELALNLYNEKNYAGSDENPVHISSPQNLVYLIYTSGTTGRPKGVMVEHQNIVNQQIWTQREYPLHEGESLLMKTTCVFDVFAWEIFWWMLEGGKIVVLPQGEEGDSNKLINIIQKKKINAIQFVPSMFNVFLDQLEGSGEVINTLHYIINIGEKLNPESVRQYNRLRNRGQVSAKLLNLYGPAETTVNSSGYECPEDLDVSRVLIGKPISNTQIYILDNKKMVGIGVPGELCITGDGVSRGYLNRAELTAEKYIENPFGSGKLYRTGDLARWMPDGNIEFLGRMDDQVKIRGFRIEPGEVENCLLALDGVSAAVVVVQKDIEGEERLCAYIVSNTENSAEASTIEKKIKNELHKTLPDYMVPTYIMCIDAIPLTHNGKLNKAALPKPTFETKEYMAPTSREEVLVIEAFEKVLDVKEIGITDNFFDLGGHSLKATLLCNELERITGTRLPLREVFALDTPGRIAERIRDIKRSSFLEIQPIAESENYPMSSVQKRLFLLNELAGPNIAYNITYTLFYKNKLDEERLQKALDKLLESEEILRTSFHIIKGELVQVISSKAHVLLEFSEIDTPNIQSEYNDFVRPFNLSSAPLMRVKLIQTPEGSYLILDLHHIIFDGESLLIMLQHLDELYEGKDLPLPRVNYKDFVVWQMNQNLERQEAYWKQEFSGDIPVLKLRTDYPRRQEKSFKGNSVQIEIDEQTHMGIKNLAKKYGATEFMVMLSSFILMLNKYSQQKDIVVGTPVSGRTHVDTENMIGMFVNTLPIKGRVELDKSFESLLLSIKEKCLLALDNQDYQYEDLVETVDAKRELSRNPLFDVMFLMQESEIMLGSKGILSGTWVAMNGSTSKFDLNLMIIHTSAGYLVNLEYCSDLFMQNTMEKMVKYYVELLEEVILHPDMVMKNVPEAPVNNMDTDAKEKEPMKKEMDTHDDYFTQEIRNLLQALHQRDQVYWNSKIKGFPCAPQFAAYETLTFIDKLKHEHIETYIPPYEWDILKKSALEKDIAPLTLLCTVYAEVLYKWTNQHEMALCLTLSNRQPFYKDTMQLVGDITSKILVGFDLSSQYEIWGRAKEIQKVLFEALNHRFYGGDEFICDLARSRGQREQSIVPIILTSMLGYESGYNNSNINGACQSPHALLDFQVMEREGGLLLTWDYVEEIFDKDMITAMFETYLNRLRQVIQNNLAAIPLPMKEAELLADYNNTTVDYQVELLQRLIDRQCRKTPNAIAVKLGEATLSYGDLARKSNQIARYLREQKYEHGSYIGVWAERQIETIINIVGILKAGYAYVPVNPEHPQDRINHILKHSGCKLLVYPDLYEEENLSAYEDESYEAGENDNQDSIQDIAYAIYTSGSTGYPKGVVITHEAVVNTLLDINEKFKVNEKDKIIGLSSMCFDLSVYDIFGALICGAQLVMIPDLMDMDNIYQVVNREEITIWNSVPAIMDMYIENSAQRAGNEPQTSLRVVMMSGDWIPLGLPEKIKNQMSGAEIISLGGATEGSIWSIYFPIKEILPDWKSIPYGYPLGNQSIYVLDQFGEECPIGVQGELYIGGKGVALGYLNDENKTEASFIKHSLGKLYKTGDYGVMHKEGYIEFLGRKDSQVKIRGHRIELGEIEYHLGNIPGVHHAVVAAYKDYQGEVYLCGYIVADEKLEIVEVQKQLSIHLPDYMIPVQIIQLDQMPLSTNGKVDRNLLPTPKMHHRENLKRTLNVNEIPKSKTEELVTKVFESVLGKDIVGINDNFFELGGYSIKVIQLCNEIEKVTGVRIPIREVFILPTPKQIAEKIRNSKADNYVEIPKIEEADSYNTSSAQKRLYLLDELIGPSVIYNVPVVIRLKDNLDEKRFQKALDQFVSREEILQTSFHMVNGKVVQKVDKNTKVLLETGRINSDDIKLEFDRFVQPFDLSKSPLMRVKILYTESYIYLFLDIHHIICDARSIPIMVNQIQELYEDRKLPTPRVQYKDFSAWQNCRDISNQVEYWKKEFLGDVPVLDLKTDYPRPQVQSFKGGNIRTSIDAQIRARTQELAQKYGATEFMVLLAAYMLLLEKYSQQEDIVVGTPVSGRIHADTDNMLGMFINTLAIKGKVCEENTFEELLLAIKEKCLQAYDNREYQFEDLVETVDVKRDFSRNPIFDVLFVLLDDETELYTNDIKFGTWIPMEGGISKFDMTMTVVSGSAGYMVDFEYCTDLFKPETIEYMKNHFKTLFKEAVLYPEKKLSEMKLTDAEEEKRLLVDFNATEAEYPYDKTIIDLFEEQVEKTPNHIAAVYGNQELSYMELNARANRLAHKLRTDFEIQPDDFVAIMADRGLEMVVGIFAILKSGAAYVPIDPTYPEERIQFILEDCKPKAVLVGDIKSGVPDELALNLYNEKNYAGSDENPVHISSPQNLVYLIYTSGTTGRPKGVMVEHQNIVNQQIWTQREYPLHEGESLLMKTTCVFDVFAWEIFWWMLEGGKIVVLPQREEGDSNKLINIIQKKKINAIQFVPSMFNVFLDQLEGSGEVINTLHYIINIGEKLNPESVRQYNRLRNRGQVRAKLLNLYGPAETTVNSSGYECPEDLDVSRVLIGKPISNTQIYILDNKKMVGIGVPGELCISGDGVSRGYLNRAELTAEKYIENPFGSGKLYRTGDLARWTPDGNIEFLGRMDDQVKIRGFRIEPGEIESCLLALEGVSAAIVMVRKDITGGDYLYAYIVSKEEITEDNIKIKLRKTLPDYMIPTRIICIDMVPLTHNGKIDKSSLPIPEYKGKEHVSPRTPKEKLVVEIFEKILGIENIGATDDFFDLGGYSLKASMLCNELEKVTGVRLALREIFLFSTPQLIAERIEQSENNAYTEIPNATKAKYYPASSAQKRLYLMDEMMGPNIAYNISDVIAYKEKLDKERLQKALDQLVKQEEILRTSFRRIDGEVVQIINSEVKVILEFCETDMIDIQKEYDNFVAPFDLSKAPLMRVKLFQTNNDSYLFWDIHHIIFDGESIPVLLQKIYEIYESETL
ncbi:amino acid adenylation domain-containing protein [Enterocloster clostridioformis]|nr:amino acid adenylation domain-containing protein [Enterocloster clostridioformis]